MDGRTKVTVKIYTEELISLINWGIKGTVPLYIGLKSAGGYFFITYKQAVAVPPTGEQIAWIKVFNQDFKLVIKEKVKSVKWGPGGGEIRPSLEITGNRIFSGQSGGLGIGKGNAEVYIYNY